MSLAYPQLPIRQQHWLDHHLNTPQSNHMSWARVERVSNLWIRNMKRANTTMKMI